ncbi:unnamed protein product [Protopolystoma xenopodis]|uniref:Rootletin-like coiled-coil domain-containing protein n=1 Tax=Protopolystoma xenopodis TaxID=117903 RepID=A0A3S5C4H9_9PLAT|nr:unnamed protein product [Protopolystoma xenopodis]
MDSCEETPSVACGTAVTRSGSGGEYTSYDVGEGGANRFTTVCSGGASGAGGDVDGEGGGVVTNLTGIHDSSGDLLPDYGFPTPVRSKTLIPMGRKGIGSSGEGGTTCCGSGGGGGGFTGSTDSERNSLVGAGGTASAVLRLENQGLRRKLAEEHAFYQRKFNNIQEGQQKQGQLVQKLQIKVLQYKEKSRALETKVQLLENEKREQKAKMEENSAELETALIRLEEEQQRAATLHSVNCMLRDQLDQSSQANNCLSGNLQDTRDELHQLRCTLQTRQTEWQSEAAAFQDYLAGEHTRLLVLWRATVSCKRHFTELKCQVERELANVNAEVGRCSRACMQACDNLKANLKGAELQHQVGNNKI